MNDIVDRLRTRYKVMCRRCEHFNCDMTTPHEVMDAAADTIARLRDENAELRARLDYRTELLERTRGVL